MVYLHRKKRFLEAGHQKLVKWQNHLVLFGTKAAPSLTQVNGQIVPIYHWQQASRPSSIYTSAKCTLMSYGGQYKRDTYKMGTKHNYRKRVS